MSVSWAKLETNWKLTGFFNSQIKLDKHFNGLNKLLNQKPIGSILISIELNLPNLLHQASWFSNFQAKLYISSFPFHLSSVNLKTISVLSMVQWKNEIELLHVWLLKFNVHFWDVCTDWDGQNPWFRWFKKDLATYGPGLVQRRNSALVSIRPRGHKCLPHESWPRVSLPLRLCGPRSHSFPGIKDAGKLVLIHVRSQAMDRREASAELVYL